MPEIVDIDELVPDDIQFKYRGETYAIPGDLRVDQTLELYKLLTQLANAESTGSEAELRRIIAKAEAALLPIFQVHQPDMEKLPFGAAGLGIVLRRVLQLIGLLQVGEAGADVPDPPKPNRAARRAKPASTPTPTKRGSSTPAKKKAAAKSGSSSRSKS
jgi:hypothetical protein